MMMRSVFTNMQKDSLRYATEISDLKENEMHMILKSLGGIQGNNGRYTKSSFENVFHKILDDIDGFKKTARDIVYKHRAAALQKQISTPDEFHSIGFGASEESDMDYVSDQLMRADGTYYTNESFNFNVLNESEYSEGLGSKISALQSQTYIKPDFKRHALSTFVHSWEYLVVVFSLFLQKEPEINTTFAKQKRMSCDFICGEKDEDLDPRIISYNKYAEFFCGLFHIILVCRNTEDKFYLLFRYSNKNDKFSLCTGEWFNSSEGSILHWIAYNYESYYIMDEFYDYFNLPKNWRNLDESFNFNESIKKFTKDNFK